MGVTCKPLPLADIPRHVFPATVRVGETGAAACGLAGRRKASGLPGRARGESLFYHYKGCCFRGKGCMTRRNEGEYPFWIFD